MPARVGVKIAFALPNLCRVCARLSDPTGLRPTALGCEARATLGHRPQNIPNPESFRGCVDRVHVAYATKGCHGSGAVERASAFALLRRDDQLPAGVPEHFHPPPPRLLPQIIGRQNPAWQQRVVRHRVQPRFALRRRPAQQCLRRRVVPQRVAGALRQHFQMPGIAAVDVLEVPRARDDFRVRSSVRSGILVEPRPKQISSPIGAKYAAPDGAWI